jgi:hypothetical protein
MPEEAQAVQFVVLHRKLEISPFTPAEDEIKNGKLWEEWTTDLETQFRYFKIESAIDKKDALMIYGGKVVKELEKSLKAPTGVPAGAQEGEALDDYTKSKWKMQKYFTKKKNVHHSTYMFNKMRPRIIGNKTEGTVAYAARLRAQAQDCEFKDNEDGRILEHIIQTIYATKISSGRQSTNSGTYHSCSQKHPRSKI